MAKLRPADVGRIAKGQTTRAALVDHARALMLERGIDDTSLQLVADAAGVSIGAIQGHFGTKNGLVLAVYSELLLEERELARRLLTEAASSSDPAAAMVQALWGAYDADRHGLLLGVERRAAHDPRLATELQRAMAAAPSVHDELAAVFGLDDGSMRARANVIVTALLGLASIRHLAPDDLVADVLAELETFARSAIRR